LIQEVWGADPLRCPLCSGLLRPIAIVETTAEILALLTPLGLERPHERPFALGPPRPEVTVLVDAASGEFHVLDPPACPPGLPYPKPRDEPIRFRAEVMERGEGFGADFPRGGLTGSGFTTSHAPPDRSRPAPLKIEFPANNSGAAPRRV